MNHQDYAPLVARIRDRDPGALGELWDNDRGLIYRFSRSACDRLRPGASTDDDRDAVAYGWLAWFGEDGCRWWRVEGGCGPIRWSRSRFTELAYEHFSEVSIRHLIGPRFEDDEYAKSPRWDEPDPTPDDAGDAPMVILEALALVDARAALFLDLLHEVLDPHHALLLVDALEVSARVLAEREGRSLAAHKRARIRAKAKVLAAIRADERWADLRGVELIPA